MITRSVRCQCRALRRSSVDCKRSWSSSYSNSQAPSSIISSSKGISPTSRKSDKKTSVIPRGVVYHAANQARNLQARLNSAWIPHGPLNHTLALNLTRAELKQLAEVLSCLETFTETRMEGESVDASIKNLIQSLYPLDCMRTFYLDRLQTETTGEGSENIKVPSTSLSSHHSSQTSPNISITGSLRFQYPAFKAKTSLTFRQTIEEMLLTLPLTQPLARRHLMEAVLRESLYHSSIEGEEDLSQIIYSLHPDLLLRLPWRSEDASLMTSDPKQLEALRQASWINARVDYLCMPHFRRTDLKAGKDECHRSLMFVERASAVIRFLDPYHHFPTVLKAMMPLLQLWFLTRFNQRVPDQPWNAAPLHVLLTDGLRWQFIRVYPFYSKLVPIQEIIQSAVPQPQGQKQNLQDQINNENVQILPGLDEPAWNVWKKAYCYQQQDYADRLQFSPSFHWQEHSCDPHSAGDTQTRILTSDVLSLADDHGNVILGLLKYWARGLVPPMKGVYSESPLKRSV